MVVEHVIENGVAVITLNRPDVLNAFNDELGFAVLEAVERSAADDSVRCIVITGAGRAFCSGEDLGALAGGYESGDAPELGKTLVDRYNPLIRAIRGARKPVIAAVNGVAAGAGASLALACDYRIATDKAKLVLAFIKVGLVPDSGGVWFLAKKVGEARAMDMAMSGRPLDAEVAGTCGLYDEVVPLEGFEERWRAVATEMADGPTRAYALTKELVYGAADRTLDEQLDHEVTVQTEAGRTADHLEGVRAFLGKRAPKFEGR
jgi:2-(1,2-epoxy-1,2-dihydrophenyl)acetyl-CoA isomerase